MQKGMRHGPQVAVGRAAMVLACQRFAVKALDPEQPKGRSAEGAFRLGNAISVAVADAHRAWIDTDGSVTISDVLTGATPPPELGHEEAARFTIATSIYSDVFDFESDEPMLRLHRHADADRTLAIGDLGAALRGRVRLAFSAEPSTDASSNIEVRSVTLGTIAEPANSLPDAVRLALLGAHSGHAARLSINPATGQHQLFRTEYSQADIAAAVDQLANRIDESIGFVGDPTPSAGWWCTSCPYVRDCPAINTERFVDVIAKYPAGLSHE
jgi:hypothetical protein